jgi:hypothetical protein
MDRAPLTTSQSAPGPPDDVRDRVTGSASRTTFLLVFVIVLVISILLAVAFIRGWFGVLGHF